MNQRPQQYTFQRYLASKRTVDDRALNHHVWEAMHDQLARRASAQHPLTILEIGGGIGTMVERLLEDGRLAQSNYHLLDEQPENIATANARLKERFSTQSPRTLQPHQFHLKPSYRQPLYSEIGSEIGSAIDLSLYTCDLYDFLRTADSLREVDLIIAHAFLDLVDIPATLPLLTTTLRPGALLYFTINFDGATILEPTIDSAFDQHVETVYHRTMDERIINGKRSGDSHTGRHLFHQLKTANIHTLDAGSSDWVIIPHNGQYPHDEAYFLHFIVNTMHGALRHHPDIDTHRFDEWIALRHTQIERGELVYIAHQLDYLGEHQG